MYLTEEETRLRERLMAEELLQQCYIDPKKELDHPPIAISYGKHSYSSSDGEVEYDTPIGTYGNFSFLQGPPKHNKTFLVTLLSAAYIGGDSNKFAGRIKGHRNGKKILHFDTEQGDFHAQRVFKRTMEMCKVDDDCYRTYALRKLSPRERMTVIRVAIEDIKNVGMVVIDGIADLVTDVNNIEECNNIVQEIMTLTQVYNIHILTVIHTNYNSNKPTGHLGSAMEKKAETQIQLEREHDSGKIITAKCKSSRSKAFDDFSFYVNNYGYPQIADDNIDWLDNIINEGSTRHTNKGGPPPVR